MAGIMGLGTFCVFTLGAHYNTLGTHLELGTMRVFTRSFALISSWIQSSFGQWQWQFG